MDRRALFFLGAAVVCALLIPVTAQEQRWVPVALVVVYTLLSVASWADRRSRTGEATRIEPHENSVSAPRDAPT